jgi:integrase
MSHTYGEGTIYQRAGSPFWWASFYHNGKGHKKSTGKRIADDPDQKAARRWLHNKQVATEAGTYVPTAAKLTFEQMADALVTNYVNNERRSLPAARASLSHLRKSFGDDKALAITTTRIESYKAARKAEQAAPGTINHELSTLRRMFSLALKAGLLTTKPNIELFAIDNARQGFCDYANFARLLEALPERVKDFIEFLYLTSWRPVEARTLLSTDVDLPGRAIRLRSEHSKTKRPRLIKLSGRLLEVVERAYAVRDLGCLNLFQHEGKPLGNFSKSWKSATAKAGLAGLLVYDLRRSGIRNMVRSGIPESVAMRISGHKTRSMFLRYDVTSEQDLDMAAARVDAYLDAQAEAGSKVSVLKPRRVA